MNQAAAPLVRIMAGYESDRRGQSLSLSISQTDIPREHHPPVPHACVRANFPLILSSAPAASSPPVYSIGFKRGGQANDSLRFMETRRQKTLPCDWILAV
jgi:hypothetical protein